MSSNIPKKHRFPLLLLILFLIYLIWSAINPKDYLIWILEVFPAVIGAIILIATYKKFRFTNLSYTLIFLFALILLTGGHYTYSEVPLFDWIKDAFELKRNHFDRMGHVMQGVVPAMIARELLIRLSVLKKGGWLFFICISISLAISAFYELIEWWVSVFSGEITAAFLAMQGDIWDTQWDMFLALLGASIALLALGRWQDRGLKKNKLTNVTK